MKYQLIYRNTNNGGEIHNVQRVDKYLIKLEEDEDRDNSFSVKAVVISGKEKVIDFIYELKLYISRKNAKEIFEDVYY
tara:strand:- start:60 stop:293 length:234 start_codon:yes stop_codon:yes gene_type:complete